MKIAIAQTIPVKGEVAQNTQQHLELIEKAGEHQADLILFPELSLTGYEPELASSLAFSSVEDTRLAVLKEAAQQYDLIVVIGLPYQSRQGVHIASFIIFPDQSIETYTKQFLHGGEADYFVPNTQHNPLLALKGEKIAFAICADITHPAHAQNACDAEATLYLAGVFITPGGYTPDVQMLQQYARQHQMTIFMANFGAPSGKFEAAGKSAAWSTQGNLLGTLSEKGCGVLIVEKTAKKWKAHEVMIDY